MSYVGSQVRTDEDGDSPSGGSPSHPNWHPIRILAVLALLILVGLWWRWADLAATQISRFVRFSAAPVLMVVLPLAGVVAAVAILGLLPGIQRRRKPKRPVHEYTLYPEPEPEPEERTDRWWRPDRSPSVIAIAVGLGLASLVGAFFMVRALNRYGYSVQHRMAGQSVQIVDGPEPGHEPRLSYPQAVERINNSLGDFRGVTLAPMYVVDGQKASWCSLLVVNSWRRGTQGVACLADGADRATVVRFAHEVPSVKAKFRLDLERRVASIARGTAFAEDDLPCHPPLMGSASSSTRSVIGSPM